MRCQLVFLNSIFGMLVNLEFLVGILNSVHSLDYWL